MKKSLLLLVIALLLPVCLCAEASGACKARRGYSVTFDKKRKKCVYKKLPRSKWKVKTERDSFTGKRYTYAYLPAEGTISGTFRRYRPELYVRCREDVLDIFVAFGPVMSCGSDTYSMRFDNYSIFEMSMAPSNDCSTMFWDDYSFSTHNFLYSMRESNQLRIRANVYAVGEEVVTFSLNGVNAFYKQMLSLCPEPPEDDDDGYE